MRSWKTLGLFGGLSIGAANMLWLYLAYWLGLHTNGIGVFQVFMLMWLGLNVFLYGRMLGRARALSESWSYVGGLRIGLLAALVAGGFAILTQVGYFKLVNPGWTDYLANAAEQMFSAQGMSGEELREKVEGTRSATTLSNYALQSWLTETFLGALLTAIVMAFLRRPTTPTSKETDRPAEIVQDA